MTRFASWGGVAYIEYVQETNFAATEGPATKTILAKPWREDVALAVVTHLEKTLGGFVPPAL